MSSVSLSLQPTFLQIQEDLRIFLGDIEEQIQSANLYSREAVLRFKESLQDYFKNWQGIVLRSKDLLSAIPGEIAQGKLFKELRQSLETCEANTKAWYYRINLQIFDGASAEKNLEEFVSFLKKLRYSGDQLASPLASLETNPSFQNLLQGRKLLASRSRLQWPRKAFHTLAGLFGLWLYGYSGLSEGTVITILVLCLSGAVTTEILRHFSPSLNQRICERMRLIMRERERGRISSATWFMGSILVVFLIFPKEVGMLALYFTAVGDTAAGIVGSRWGKHRFGEHVSLEGSAAAFLVCFSGTMLLASHGLEFFHPQGIHLWIFSTLAGLTAALAESSFKRLDDNMVIPLFSAPVLWILMRIL